MQQQPGGGLPAPPDTLTSSPNTLSDIEKLRRLREEIMSGQHPIYKPPDVQGGWEGEDIGHANVDGGEPAGDPGGSRPALNPMAQPFYLDSTPDQIADTTDGGPRGVDDDANGFQNASAMREQELRNRLRSKDHSRNRSGQTAQEQQPDPTGSTETTTTTKTTIIRESPNGAFEELPLESTEMEVTTTTNKVEEVLAARDEIVAKSQSAVDALVREGRDPTESTVIHSRTQEMDEVTGDLQGESSPSDVVMDVADKKPLEGASKGDTEEQPMSRTSRPPSTSIKRERDEADESRTLSRTQDGGSRQDVVEPPLPAGPRIREAGDPGRSTAGVALPSFKKKRNEESPPPAPRPAPSHPRPEEETRMRDYDRTHPATPPSGPADRRSLNHYQDRDRRSDHRDTLARQPPPPAHRDSHRHRDDDGFSSAERQRVYAKSSEPLPPTRKAAPSFGVSEEKNALTADTYRPSEGDKPAPVSVSAPTGTGFGSARHDSRRTLESRSRSGTLLDRAPHVDAARNGFPDSREDRRFPDRDLLPPPLPAVPPRRAYDDDPRDPYGDRRVPEYGYDDRTRARPPPIADRRYVDDRVGESRRALPAYDDQRSRAPDPSARGRPTEPSSRRDVLPPVLPAPRDRYDDPYYDRRGAVPLPRDDRRYAEDPARARYDDARSAYSHPDLHADLRPRVDDRDRTYMDVDPRAPPHRPSYPYPPSPPVRDPYDSRSSRYGPPVDPYDLHHAAAADRRPPPPPARVEIPPEKPKASTYRPSYDGKRGEDRPNMLPPPAGVRSSSRPAPVPLETRIAPPAEEPSYRPGDVRRPPARDTMDLDREPVRSSSGPRYDGRDRRRPELEDRHRDDRRRDAVPDTDPRLARTLPSDRDREIRGNPERASYNEMASRSYDSRSAYPRDSRDYPAPTSSGYARTRVDDYDARDAYPPRGGAAPPYGYGSDPRQPGYDYPPAPVGASDRRPEYRRPRSISPPPLHKRMGLESPSQRAAAAVPGNPLYDRDERRDNGRGFGSGSTGREAHGNGGRGGYSSGRAVDARDRSPPRGPAK